MQVLRFGFLLFSNIWWVSEHLPERRLDDVTVTVILFVCICLVLSSLLVLIMFAFVFVMLHLLGLSSFGRLVALLFSSV